jgi:hypothetical protein
VHGTSPQGNIMIACSSQRRALDKENSRVGRQRKELAQSTPHIPDIAASVSVCMLCRII